MGDYMIYFDNAATTGKKPKGVVDAVNFALKNLCANPGRSGHTRSQNAAMTVYNSRKSVSEFFGSDGAETVVFTANCTESINFVLKGILTAGDHVVVSDFEHNAVMRPLNTMGIEISEAEVLLNDDEKTAENFKKAIKDNTKMIFCTAASNVLGKILPLKKIGEICKENKILFGVDAAQGAGMMPINMKEMNIDFLCIAPHKGLYCPMGLGILIARKPIDKTLIEGGTGTESLSFKQPSTLPEMLESGTVNLPAIAAIGCGIDFVKSNSRILQYENGLIKQFFDGLQNKKVIFYTNPYVTRSVPVLSFNIKGKSSEKVAEYLNIKGFALRGGLHCAPTAHRKIGTLDCGTVRFSPSVFNNRYEVSNLIKQIKIFSNSY